MVRKSEYLQIRVTPAQKKRLRRRARRAGVDLWTYVLSKVDPPAAASFQGLVSAFQDPAERRYALAALNDLLSGLATAELVDAVADADLTGLDAADRNRVAAMVEQACARKGVAPAPWVRDVPPLDAPLFATDLKSLRAHLLRVSPVAFRRRNLFVDAAIGDRV
jgi:hypothetical protein